MPGQKVAHCTIDRKAENFGSTIVALEPDVVIDLICYSLANAQQLLESLKEG